jgi:hypothetical protein
MGDGAPSNSLEEQLALWRERVERHVAEVEQRLREQAIELLQSGWPADQAVRIAEKRIFPLERTGAGTAAWDRNEFGLVLALAIGAAIVTKLPSLFGVRIEEAEGFYLRNLSFLVLPFLAAYFAWKRRLRASLIWRLATVFAVAAVIANFYPFAPAGQTERLTALHLPIGLWITLGTAYAGDRWKKTAGRMEFIRFSGEFLIYYVLIALGGGVLMALMAMLFQAIGINPEHWIQSWVLPCGAAGAVVIATWLAETQKGLVSHVAPMLARVFSPLFAGLLICFLAVLLWTGRGINLQRNALIAFDLLLAAVLGLVIYTISSRDARTTPRALDLLPLILLTTAWIADTTALAAIAVRISEFGFSPNRTAALGENLILLVNITWSAVLYVRFLRARLPFSSLENWQTRYLPIYAVWAAIVVIVFPPLFKFA